VDTQSEEGRKHQLSELRFALEQDMGDYFSFTLDESIDVESDGSMTIPIDARIGAKQFARFEIDLAPVGVVTESEYLKFALPVPIELHLPEIDVPVLRLEFQIADKVCAMFERHGVQRIPSSRWRDLADIAMIAQQTENLDATSLITAITSESQRRKSTLPVGLPHQFELDHDQLHTWRTAWGARGRFVEITIEEALETAGSFVGPLLNSSAIGTWQPHHMQWMVSK
jgi:hypothetical protein